METTCPDIAKITRPRAGRLLQRPRLFAALDEARQASATWISAPPGFGKTSLASSYVEQRGLDCLWYRVDGEDADVGNFFHYLNQAGTNLPHHERELPRFTPDNLPRLAAFARRFFESLCLRLRAPALLIFDDYQEAAPDCPLHAALVKAVEHLPGGIHIVFLSREQPPPAFVRLRAHGAFAHLDADALKLTTDEAAALAERKGARAPDEVPRLNELAGGWAAGLMLLLERGDLPVPARLPDAATLQVLFDYFSQEIFATLKPEVRALLLECALLPDMPADAVRRLTRAEDAVLLLEELSTKNYFTTRHEGAAAVYRFHPLFRAFLQAHAERTMPRDQFAARQAKAAHILVQAGYTDDAVELLHACGDWETLAQIVLGHAEQLARQGRLQTLRAWITHLPGPVIEESGWLLFWLGSCQLPFDPIGAKGTLLRAYAVFEAAQDVAGLYLSWAAIATIHNFTWSSQEEFLGWISGFETLQGKYPDFPSPAVEARVALGVVALLMLCGLGHERLPYWLERCRSLMCYLGDHSTRLLAGHQLAWVYSWLGKGAEGAALVREMAPLVGDDVAPLARLNYLDAVAIYAWHQADAASCADAVDQALRLADESELHLLDPYIGMIGVYGALSVGDTAAARALLPRFENTAVLPRQMDASAFASVQLLLNLHSGDWEEAARYGRQTLAIHEDLGFMFGVFMSRICLASVLLELGQGSEAEELLEAASRLAQGVDSPLIAHLLLLGRALAAFKRGHEPEALDFLRGASQNAQACGGHYTPFYCRKSLAELYALGLEANVEASHLQNQIRRHRLVPPASAPDSWSWPIKIYTLGRFAIAKDGASLKTGAKSSRKPIELLKTLIAHGGRDVHQERLVAALWPDAEGDDAHHAFETTLYRLRKLLGAEAVQVKDGRLTLDPAHCWVDCWAFERLHSSVIDAIAADDSAAVARDAQRLLGLYQGPFLGRDYDIPVAIAHGERLRSRLLRALESLGKYWAGRQDTQKTLECHLRALEVDPRAEVFYQGLMRHYHAQGRYPEAIAVYQRCRLALHSLVGVAPSADTNALYAAALAAAADPSSPVPAAD